MINNNIITIIKSKEKIKKLLPKPKGKCSWNIHFITTKKYLLETANTTGKTEVSCEFFLTWAALLTAMKAAKSSFKP